MITPEAVAAKGRAGKEFWVAVMRAASIRAVGLKVEPDPKGTDVAHAEVRELHFGITEHEVTEISLKLRSTMIEMKGPFPGEFKA